MILTDTRVSCRGKKAHSSFDEARIAADWMNTRERGYEGHYVCPYFCFLCTSWHTGNKPFGRKSSTREDAVRYFRMFKKPLPEYIPPARLV